MTKEEKLFINVNAICEELRYYENLNRTYLDFINNSLSAKDIDKIEFGLNNIKKCFELVYKPYSNNSVYKMILDILIEIEQIKEDRNKRRGEISPLIKFWTAINAWLSDEAEHPALLFNEKYQEGYSEYGQWLTVGVVYRDKLYRTILGKPYIEISEENVSIALIKEFIETYYKEVIEPDNGRFKFTVQVNEYLKRFNMPYKLQKGKLVQVGYKSSNNIETIENFEMFERKLEYAAEMIMHGEFIDKHSALNYIVDAFCYFSSLYNKDDKQLSELVNSNNNTHIYKIIKDEVGTIMRIINDDFDIRHNEIKANNKNGRENKREVLMDSIFVEYLYNRINALLSILRIKRSILLQDSNKGLPF